jgi:paraquat-inducible protein B
VGKPASRTLIGAFVVGAVALLAAAVIVFGGGKFLRSTQKAVTFFEGSIKGLSVGSPVMFRGVKVGSVIDIQLIMDTSTLRVTTPVVIEVDLDRWKLYGGWTRGPESARRLVKAGLRAQLQTLSFVTGQLLVGLDFFPNRPARFVGLMPQYPEIPSVPAPTEELTKTLQELPIREIAEKLELALDGIQRLANSSDARDSVRAARQAAVEARELMRRLDERIVPLADSLGRLADTADNSVARAGDALAAVQGNAAEVSAAARKTLEAATATLERADRTLTAVSDDSQIIHEANRSLKELSAAARSVRDLADYLERHPEAIIRGKPKPRR